MKVLAATLLMTAALGAQIVEGNAKSHVRVVAYEDLQCSDCAVYRKMLDEQLLPKYGSTVAFEHRDFPLPKHKWARDAAIAARSLDSSGLGVDFRRWCYANMKSLTPENFRELATAWAQNKKTKVSFDDAELAKLVDADFEEGVARGVARTPTVFVNGEPFIETFSFEDVAKAIEAALKAK